MNFREYLNEKSTHVDEFSKIIKSSLIDKEDKSFLNEIMNTWKNNGKAGIKKSIQIFHKDFEYDEELTSKEIDSIAKMVIKDLKLK